MAHFSQLDENNVVIRTIVVANNDISDFDGNEYESKGIDYCKKLFGQNTKWIQTSYNKTFRKDFARPGWTYDSIKDAFIPPKPQEGTFEFNEEFWMWIEVTEE